MKPRHYFGLAAYLISNTPALTLTSYDAMGMASAIDSPNWGKVIGQVTEGEALTCFAEIKKLSLSGAACIVFAPGMAVGSVEGAFAYQYSRPKPKTFDI